MRKFLIIICLLSIVSIAGCGGGGGGGVQYGSVAITSIPSGAEIYIDGNSQNKFTPATIDNLTAGTHTLKLKKEGRKEYTDTIVIEANKTLTLPTITLDPLDAGQAGGFTEPNFEKR